TTCESGTKASIPRPKWRNWQTRRIQNPVPVTGVRVRVPPSALAGSRLLAGRSTVTQSATAQTAGGSRPHRVPGTVAASLVAQCLAHLPLHAAVLAAIDEFRAGRPVLVRNPVGPDQFPDVAIWPAALILRS